MANPTISDLHVSAALTDLSVLNAGLNTGSVHDKIFPIVPVKKQGDKYFVYNTADWLRTDAQPRAPGAEAAVSGWRLSKDSYYAERVALAHDISDPERANADPAVSNLDGDAVDFVTQHIRLRNEKDFVAAFFTTGIWTGTKSGGDMTGLAAPASTATNFRFWNDVASTPIEDLRGEIMSIAGKTGLKPNTLTLGPRVWAALQDHPDIIDRIKYTEKGIVTEDLIASLLGLDRVLVGMMIENTAIEGAAAGTNDFIAGRNALLSYSPPSPGLKVPSAGYTFVWTGMPGAPPSGLGARIKRYRLERNESDRIEGERWSDLKVVGPTLGAFFTAAVST